MTTDLAHLRELLDRATPARMEVVRQHPETDLDIPPMYWLIVGEVSVCISTKKHAEVARLIAAAVNALPGLLDEVERLEKDNETWHRPPTGPPAASS